jgi:hypothetical protein
MTSLAEDDESFSTILRSGMTGVGKLLRHAQGGRQFIEPSNSGIYDSLTSHITSCHFSVLCAFSGSPAERQSGGPFPEAEAEAEAEIEPKFL